MELAFFFFFLGFRKNGLEFEEALTKIMRREGTVEEEFFISKLEGDRDGTVCWFESF